jgi:hypothetical protein
MLAAAAVGLLTAPAVASRRHRARSIRVDLVNRDRQIPIRQIERGARALQTQVNEDLRSWWPGPKIKIELDKPARMARWLVTLEPADAVFGEGSGLHKRTRQQVWAKVYPGSFPWAWAASHELLEMLEDPGDNTIDHGSLREICDPVAAIGYQIGTVTVSDFVTPAWFKAGSSGPWDLLDELAGPLHWDPASIGA